MKTSNSLQARSEKINQKDELKNLRDAHTNEVEKIKNSHSIKKSELKNSFRAELGTRRNESDKRLILENIKNEKVLNDLKSSIQDVKEVTTKEKINIQKTHDDKLTGTKVVFEEKYANLAEKQNFLLQELDQQSQIETKKMARRHKLQQEEVTNGNKNSQEVIKTNHLKTVQLNADSYGKKQNAQTDKFHNALLIQKKNHNKDFVTTERTHQNGVKNRNEVYKATDLKIQENGQKRITQSKKRFENAYNSDFKKSENTLQHLSKNKEKILNNLKSMFKKEVKLEVDRDKDPFFQFQKIEPKLEPLENGSGYSLTINTPKEFAKDFQLTGSDRELKITMKRNYKFKNTENSGEFNSVSKVETYITKVPIKQIIDPNSITKSYTEGKLKFNIKLA
jgi:hypothetical protein